MTVTEIEAIDLVLEYYGKMSGVELINQIHQDAPWRNVYEPNKKHIIITRDSMFNFYKENYSFKYVTKAIEQQLDDMEDYYLAEQSYNNWIADEKKTYTIDEVFG